MNSESPSITVANDQTLSELIRSARRRLVILAPALSNAVAQSVADQWQSLGAAAVSVVLDVDAEVYRLGYGNFEALSMLEQVAASLRTTLNRQSGVRIGVVIADDEMLVYSPTPLLIEAGPREPAAAKEVQPNAIRVGPPPQQIENELGQGPNGVIDQIVGLDKAEKQRITHVDTGLSENPPQKFNISRSVRVFNAAFEFVEFELSGTFIDRKTVPIPKHLSGIADAGTRKQLRTSFRILPPDHELSGEHLQKDKNLIARQFLRTITGYGSVVLRSQKDDFEKEVAEFQAKVKAFAQTVRAELQAAMDANREALVNAILPIVERNVPNEWCRSDGAKPDATALRQFLDSDLRRAFGTADQLIRHMDVKLVFKGVTYELLSNEKFMEQARRAIPELATLYDEYDAAKAVPEPPIAKKSKGLFD